MATIPNTDFKYDVRLANILYCKTMESMLKIANRLDLSVSPTLAVTIRTTDNLNKTLVLQRFMLQTI